MKRRPITPLVREKAGVPSGGTTGQSLVKISGKNFDTGWGITPTGIGSLPSGPSIGQLAVINDGFAALAWGDVAVGGGSRIYLVWWDGNNWSVLGKEA